MKRMKVLLIVLGLLSGAGAAYAAMVNTGAAPQANPTPQFWCPPWC